LHLNREQLIAQRLDIQSIEASNERLRLVEERLEWALQRAENAERRRSL
jgi:hypothetical protein